MNARRLPLDAVAPLRRLTDVSRALTNAASLGEVFELTVECAVEIVGAPRAVLALSNDAGLLRIRGARGIEPDAAAAFAYPLDEQIRARIEDVFGAGGARRFAGVPIVVGGRITGVLAVDLGRDGPADEHDEWLLSALADQASVAIEAARGVAVRGELEARVRRLEAGRAETDRAVRIVSHDLRTPLASIQGYVELLTSGVYGPITERQTEALERIRTVGRHLQSVIESIVEVTRLATVDPAVDVRAVSLGSILNEAVALVAPSAKSKRIALRLQADASVRIVADPDRLRQVVVHVLDNAIKYCPPDTAVHVETALAKHELRGAATVIIRDEGPGIPAAYADEVFLPSRRLGSGSQDDPGGSGLGLWIARSLMQRMDGSIELDLGATTGATFRIRVPLAGIERRGESRG